MLILLHNPVLLHWIRGFSRNIGSTTSLIAEIWALRNGLNLRIISSLIDDCRTLASLIHHKKIGHCFREANKCVNALANIRTSQLVYFVLFDAPLGVVDVFNSELFKLHWGDYQFFFFKKRHVVKSEHVS